jgi:hypothetical protein
MRTWFLKRMMTAAIALPALSGPAWAGGTDDFGCSNATLRGEYAFGVTSYSPNYPPNVVAGIKVFDGKGGLTQRDYMGDGVPADFSPPGQEKGSYQVNADCTGSMGIHLNAPVTTGSTGVINILFVIADGGVISTKSFRHSLRPERRDP